MYLGSGFGLLIFWTFRYFRRNHVRIEAGLKKKDTWWLLGAVMAGGIAAPIVLMYSLKVTPASTASLLLNFESVSTTLIATAVFKEAVGRRVWLAVVFITAASILLSLRLSDDFGFSTGALGVIFACIMWGLDNNLTRNVSAKDPLITVIIKGAGAGSFSLLLAIKLGAVLPESKIILGALLLGFVCYGLSIVLFIYAMRNLGASRTSAFFGTAPFIGSLLSFLIFHESPGTMFIVSLPVMVLGTVLLFSEAHAHEHVHENLEHEHRHSHDDGHHGHSLTGEAPQEHSHLHSHEKLKHSHPHMPDIHHRHAHL